MILTYHTFSLGVTDELFRRSVAAFASDLELLAGNVVSLDDWLDSREGVVLTFDDASGSQLDLAVPLMREAGVTGTFYIPTSLVARIGYMTWPDICRLEEEGFTIGSHGHSHHELRDMSEAEAEADLVTSQLAFMRGLGHPVAHMATPFGCWTPELADMARVVGFRSMRTTAREEYTDDFCLPSEAMSYDTDLAEVLK